MSVTNGNGVNGYKHDGLQWKIGLLNSAQKYLTAETFGHKINSSGAALKKKQVWTLEQDATDEVVYLRSHLGCYISTDKYGKVTCEAECRGNSEKFVVEYNQDGRWAFRNVEFGYYFGGADDNLYCSAKSAGHMEWWTIQLDIHPQVNLRNANRKRYAVLRDDQLQGSELIPWGPAALILMEFVDGKYAIKTSDNRYLQMDGSLSETLEPDCKYTLEIKSGLNSGFAFKDIDGRYLTAVGATATIKGRNKQITKDELFTLESSHPQAIITSIGNGKRVSIKQGLDVSANQDTDEDLSEMETFQIEYDKSSQKWGILAVNGKYWAQEKAGIQAKDGDLRDKSLFELEWLGDGSVAIKAANNCYVYAKPTGSLTASSDKVTDKERFRITLVNRPLLVLKSEHGYVGFKTQNLQRPELVCNKGSYDAFHLIASQSGHYFLRGHNGKYWRVMDDGSIYADSSKPIPFILEFRGQSVVSLQASNGCYVKGEQNGTFRAIAKEITNNVIWEC